MAGVPTIAVSPGGKFLVCGTSRRLELIDLDAGRLLAASDPGDRWPTTRFDACAFPPMANCWLVCLWNQPSANQLLEIYRRDARGGQRNGCPCRREGPYGHASIQFLADKSGWLVDQHVLVPLREGSASLAQPVQGAGGKVSIVGGRVVDTDHLFVWNREALTVFRLPRDASGKRMDRWSCIA